MQLERIHDEECEEAHDETGDERLHGCDEQESNDGAKSHDDAPEGCGFCRAFRVKPEDNGREESNVEAHSLDGEMHDVEDDKCDDKTDDAENERHPATDFQYLLRCQVFLESFVIQIMHNGHTGHEEHSIG